MSNGANDAFQDPLEDYEAKTYSDPLEQALAEDNLDHVRQQPYASIAPTATVREAIAKLCDLQIGCLLVEQDGQLRGVLSDRDVLDRVMLEYEQVADQPVSEVMTREPIYVYDTDCPAAVLNVMAVSGYRHVPVVDVHNQLVGIVSPQRVTEYLQKFF